MIDNHWFILFEALLLGMILSAAMSGHLISLPLSLLVGVLGAYWFYQGFRELKVIRTLEDIPTCKINTGAVGTNVEIKGRIVCEKDKLITAPISGKTCVNYFLEIEQYDSDGWLPHDSFFSDEGIFLDDGSGATAMVLLNGAKINHERTQNVYERANSIKLGTPTVFLDSDRFEREGKMHKLKSNHYKMPPNLISVLRANQKNLKKFKVKKSLFGGFFTYRFIEWRFDQNDFLYVLGFAASGLMLKKNNKPAAKNAKDKMEEPLPKTKMIFRKTKLQPFIVSDREEKDMSNYFINWATLKIWGGGVLTSGCLVAMGIMIYVRWYLI